MWFKQKWRSATVLVLAASALSINQAQALGDDEAAILVGVAVGGLTTYALQQAGKHHHGGHYGGHRDGGYEYEYERREYREPPRRHHSHTRVEHYVIHNPPQHRDQGYHRVGHGHHKGDRRGRGHRGGGYEYEYEYKRRSSF